MEVVEVAVIVLAVLVTVIFVILNRWIKAFSAHVSDANRPITPELITVWKKQITNHEEGTPTYNSYKASLIRAGEKVP